MSYQTYVVLGLTALVLVLLTLIRARTRFLQQVSRILTKDVQSQKPVGIVVQEAPDLDRCALTLHSSRVLASLAVFESSHYLLPIIQALETHRFCIGAELKGKIF